MSTTPHAWLTGLLATVPPATLGTGPEHWANAIMGALTAAAPPAPPDPRLDQIISIVQGMKTAAPAAVVGSAAATSVAAAVPAAAALSVPTFNASDATPNAPGGRNSPRLPNFKAAMPATS